MNCVGFYTFYYGCTCTIKQKNKFSNTTDMNNIKEKSLRDAAVFVNRMQVFQQFKKIKTRYCNFESLSKHIGSQKIANLTKLQRTDV